MGTRAPALRLSPLHVSSANIILLLRVVALALVIQTAKGILVKIIPTISIVAISEQLKLISRVTQLSS